MFLNGLKDSNFIQNFMNELSNNIEKNANDKLPIIDEILSKNNVTTGNENSIRWKVDEVVVDYVNRNFNNDTMYFVKDNKKTYWLKNQKHYNDKVFSVLKVENGKLEEIEINKTDMPRNIGVNDVFKIENGNYISNKEWTTEIKQEIKSMADKIIEKQNVNLSRYRKEGHLYKVREEIGNNRFLWDMTDLSKVQFEEVNIPKDVLEKATEGAILKFSNGKYEYYKE